MSSTTRQIFDPRPTVMENPTINGVHLTNFKSEHDTLQSDHDTLQSSYNTLAAAVSNVTNESKATMFSNPTFTGTTTVDVLHANSIVGTGAGTLVNWNEVSVGDALWDLAENATTTPAPIVGFQAPRGTGQAMGAIRWAFIEANGRFEGTHDTFAPNFVTNSANLNTLKSDHDTLQAAFDAYDPVGDIDNGDIVSGLLADDAVTGPKVSAGALGAGLGKDGAGLVALKYKAGQFIINGSNELELVDADDNQLDSNVLTFDGTVGSSWTQVAASGGVPAYSKVSLNFALGSDEFTWSVLDTSTGDDVSSVVWAVYAGGGVLELRVAQGSEFAGKAKAVEALAA